MCWRFRQCQRCVVFFFLAKPMEYSKTTLDAGQIHSFSGVMFWTYIKKTNKPAANLHINTQVWSTVCRKIDWTFFFSFYILTERCSFAFLVVADLNFTTQFSFPLAEPFSSFTSLYIGGDTRPSTFTLALLNKRGIRMKKKGKRTGTSGVIHSREKKKKGREDQPGRRSRGR